MNNIIDLLNQLNQVVTGTLNDIVIALNNDIQFKNAVLDFLESQEKGENYGISFLSCGFNGKKQKEFQDRIKKEYNLIIF